MSAFSSGYLLNNLKWVSEVCNTFDDLSLAGKPRLGSSVHDEVCLLLNHVPRKENLKGCFGGASAQERRRKVQAFLSDVKSVNFQASVEFGPPPNILLDPKSLIFQ